MRLNRKIILNNFINNNITLGDVISKGIYEGVLKTLSGKYFKSTGSDNCYFYFPIKNIKSSSELSFHDQLLDFNTNIGDLKLRAIIYHDNVFNPTKIQSLIRIDDLLSDYEEISREEFKSLTDPIQEEIDKFK